MIEVDGRLAGALRVVLVSEHSRLADVRTVMVDPSLARRGIAVAALRALADALLRDGPLHRLQAESYGSNEAARRTFLAAGFRLDGVRRRAWWRDGQWHDGLLFGLVAEDLD